MRKTIEEEQERAVGAALRADALAGGDHLGLLASVSQAFASSLDLEETLQNAVTQITHYMNAEAASLFLLEEEGEVLVCRSSVGPVDLVGLRLDAGKGIVGKTVREGRVQFIRDVEEDADFAGFVDQATGFRTRSILCAPLNLKGERLGALEVLNREAGDHLFDDSDKRLLQVLASSASLVIHNARMASRLVEQERMRKELELAREIQAHLLPGDNVGAFPVVGVNVPAREVSGDFFDYFRLADGRIAFNLGDVSGKGMDAALLMAKTTSLLHCLGKNITEPSALLRRVNEEVCESATRGMFVTLVAGVYDPDSGAILLSNAGHQPPLFVAADGRHLELPATAPPLGVVDDLCFETEALRLKGGSLYLYTDGVTEARVDGGSPLGVEGVLRLVREHAARPPVERLRRIVDVIRGGAEPQRDDVTLLVIEAVR